MPDHPSSFPLATALTRVAQRGLTYAGFDTVRDAALAVWCGEENPELDSVQGPHVVEALLLVERLSYYNVVPQLRKRVLLSRVRQALAKFKEAGRADFEFAYKAFLPQLQPLQSRHYTCGRVEAACYTEIKSSGRATC